MAFPGDFLLVAYLLGLMRFFTIVAALDTGSSFEGMGASREAFLLRAGRAGVVARAWRRWPAQSHSLSLSDDVRGRDVRTP